MRKSPHMLVTVVAVASILASGACVAAETFYVSTQGNDNWSGKLNKPNAGRTDGPLATLGGARDAIRELKTRGPLTQPVQVWVSGRVYRIEKPFTLDPRDSGTQPCPVTYAAAPGERPIISGGRRITGWSKGEGPLWVADVPQARQGEWYFHQLFVNGARRTRARTPNEGYLLTEGPIEPLADRRKARGDASTKMGFRFKPGDIKPWPGLGDVNVFAYHSWTASLHWVASVDEASSVVRFTARSNWPIGYWEAKQRYTVENCRAALDAPGEWYLDRATGLLHYWPVAGEDPRQADVVAPVLGRLVEFQGEPELGLCVEHVTLRGLSFQHADWILDKSQPADGQGAAFQKDAALLLHGAQRCALEQCEIAHVGMYALWLRQGCQDNRIVQCHIHDLGTGGIRIGETFLPRDKARAADRNVVDNCFIHDGGHVFPAGHGVWIGRASHNTVRHCEICDFYYSGVSIGWSWGYAASTANHNTLEYCHIHDLGKGVLSDMGGFYTLGVSPGTRIANNVFHDVYSYSYGGWGMYTDEGSSHITMENNVVYNTKTGGFHQHYGRENVIRNNVLAFSKAGQVIRSREEEHVSFTFERNIVLVDNALPLGGRWTNGNFKLDSNLYWNTTDEEMDFSEWSFEDWQDEGHDAHSLVADPLFVDVKRYDFRVKPGSPAFKLGFKDIDTSEVGLYGEAEWTEPPTRIVRPPVSYPVKPVKPKLKSVNDDFETTKVGDVAAHARSSEGVGGPASIRVTDETAAAGKHSLKFTDAPGLNHEWNPHMYYQVKFKRGRVEASFYMRFEPGARMYHEWRDYRGKYKVGPNFALGSDGQLSSNGKPLLQLPASQWFRVEITCPVGRKSAKQFDMTIALPDDTRRSFEGLPFRDPAFRSLTWFGFSSTATDKAVVYLDDLHLNLKK